MRLAHGFEDGPPPFSSIMARPRALLGCLQGKPGNSPFLSRSAKKWPKKRKDSRRLREISPRGGTGNFFNGSGNSNSLFGRKQGISGMNRRGLSKRRPRSSRKTLRPGPRPAFCPCHPKTATLTRPPGTRPAPPAQTVMLQFLTVDH